VNHSEVGDIVIYSGKCHFLGVGLVVAFNLVGPLQAKSRTSAGAGQSGCNSGSAACLKFSKLTCGI
jgi:hypothetical protein